MGNQPSSTATLSPQTPNPVAPVCDVECQREKELASLKSAMDSAYQNRLTDPQTYEQVRLAYYTLLKGNGWAVQEKQKIAREEIEPILSQYSKEYNALKAEQKSQSMFVDLAKALKTQEDIDTADNLALKRQLQEETDKASTLKRLNELQTTQAPSTNWTSIINTVLDGILVLFGIIIVWKLFSKMDSIKSYLGYGNAVPSMS